MRVQTRTNGILRKKSHSLQPWCNKIGGSVKQSCDSRVFTFESYILTD
jgi:hypothetical protein